MRELAALAESVPMAATFALTFSQASLREEVQQSRPLGCFEGHFCSQRYRPSNNAAHGLLARSVVGSAIRSV